MTEGETINRNEVWVLSDTEAYDSATVSTYNWYIDEDGLFNYGIESDFATGDGQTYDDDKLGTIPNRFAGLASQMADFFNKSTTGTVTFVFTPPVNNSTGGTWASGGIPSTEVGIKNMLSSAQTNDFALFVNYGSTTGSMQATTEIDAASGFLLHLTFPKSSTIWVAGQRHPSRTYTTVLTRVSTHGQTSTAQRLRVCT